MIKTPIIQALSKDQWVKPFFKRYKKSLILALFLGFLTFFAASALMFNSGYLISKSASLPSNILLVYIPIVLTRAFGIGRPIFRYIERLTSHNWVLKMTSKLRLKLYETLEQDAIFLSKNYRLGDIMGLLAEDINHIQNLYLRTVFPTIIAWVLYVFLIVGLGYFNIWFALFVLFYLGILVFLFPLWSVLVNGARQEQEKQLKSQLYTDLTDNILGISDWIFSQRGQEYVDLHAKSEAELAVVQAKMKVFDNRRNFIFQMAFAGLGVLTLVWAAYQFPGSHGGPANWIAAFVLSVFPLIDAFGGLSAASQESTSYADSLNRLNDLPQISAVEISNDLPTAPFDLKIAGLNFNYADSDKQVLANINLEIKAGQRLAILGKSGSGKSTLASLLRGDLQASSGTISLSGIPVTSLGEKVSNHIGVIQQAPYLFNTSLLNNIRLGNHEASEEDVWDVLAKVGLKAMVTALPNGIHTMVDEAGLRFSGGERHRIALARILLQDTPIVLLDEPTVGLDPITEKTLLETIMEALEGKTLIWITHHLKGIEKADRVIFIEDGQIKISGSPSDLLETNLRYQKLKAIDDGR